MGFLRNLFTRAREATQTLIHWMGPWMSSDVEVTDDSYPEAYALNPWVYACVRTVARSAATVPVKLFRVKPNGEEEEITKSPILDVLAYVNVHEDFYTLQQATVSWLNLHGNAYWFPVRPTPNSDPVALQWLPADKITVTRKDGRTVYEMDEGSGTKRKFNAEELVHTKLFSAAHQYLGQSPIRPIENEINAYTQASRFNYNYLKQGGVPSSILYGKQRMSKEQKGEFRESWDQSRGDSKSAGRPLALGDDLRLETVGTSPDSVTTLELPLHLAKTIAAVFGVPHGVIGILDDASYSNLRVQERLLWRDAILPILAQQEAALNGQFLPMFKKSENLRLRFDLSKVEALQPDMDAVADRIAKLVPLGTLLNNEARELLQKDPVEYGDTWFGPFSLGPIATKEGGAEEKAVPGGEERTRPGSWAIGGAVPNDGRHDHTSRAETASEAKLRRLSSEQRSMAYRTFNSERDNAALLLQRIVAGWYEWLGKQVVKNINASDGLSRAANQRAPAPESLAFLIDDAAAELTRLMMPAVREVYQEAGEAAAERFGLEIAFDPDTSAAQQLLRSREREFKSITQRAQERVTKTLAEGLAEGENVHDLTARVSDFVRVGKEHYAEVTARTEAGTAMNAAASDSYEQAGATHKEWLSILDDRTRDEEFDHVSADGEIVPIKDPFTRTGESLMHPQASGGSAGNVINCRCTSAPVFEEE